MGLNPMKWKTRTVAIGSIGIFIFYSFFVYKKTHEAIFESVVKNSKPVHVWEFVADFSNMKKLNPTIEDFDVIAEDGNLDLWKYSVKYTERLSHFPAIQNTAHGHFVVKPEENGFLIESNHRTCFFLDFYCLDSVSQFKFDPDGANDTKCRETVWYQCPMAFLAICRKEVMYQRREIMDRLKQEFSLEKSKGLR